MNDVTQILAFLSPLSPFVMLLFSKPFVRDCIKQAKKMLQSVKREHEGSALRASTTEVKLCLI